jgi:Family of unknown function (DUF6203)
MKNLFKLLITRRLARTPLGLIILGLGWLLARRRKHHKAHHEAERRDHTEHRPRIPHRLPY